MNNKKNAILTLELSIIIIFVMIFCTVTSVTYALKNYSVTFMRAEGTETMKVCYTDVNGKLTEECLNEISKVCSKWAIKKCQHSGCKTTNELGEIVVDYQGESKTISELGEVVFETDKKYYCLSGTSIHNPDPEKGCYVCKSDNAIVKWGFSADGDSKCPSGYEKDTTKNEETCKVNACYVCKTNEKVYEWRDNDLSNDACPGGYEKVNKIETECKYVEPNACYVCKTNEKIIKWKNNDLQDDECTDGYDKTEKSETECKYVEPNACYVCKTNEKIIKWKNNDLQDDECTDGYDKTEKSETECKYVEPNACYVCKTNEKIIKWKNNDLQDDECTDGYDKTEKSEKNCKYIEIPPNPKTGKIELISSLILLILTVALVGFQLYLNKRKIYNNE